MSACSHAEETKVARERYLQCFTFQSHYVVLLLRIAPPWQSAPRHCRREPRPSVVLQIVDILPSHEQHTCVDGLSHKKLTPWYYGGLLVTSLPSMATCILTYTNTALCPLALVKSTVRIKFSSKMLFVFVFVSPPTGRTGCRWRHYRRVTRPAVSYALFYIY